MLTLFVYCVSVDPILFSYFYVVLSFSQFTYIVAVALYVLVDGVCLSKCNTKRVITLLAYQILCQILTNFQNFYTAGMHAKFAPNPIQHHPPQLRHVVTLPWKIKNYNFSEDIHQMWKKWKPISFLRAPIIIPLHV